MRPTDFEPHHDGLPFHFRILNGGWQVYGFSLRHVAHCDTRDAAEMIADALNCCALNRQKDVTT